MMVILILARKDEFIHSDIKIYMSSATLKNHSNFTNIFVEYYHFRYLTSMWEGLLLL